MAQNPGQIRKALDVRLWTSIYPASALPAAAADHDWSPADNGFTDLGRTSLGSPPGQTNEPSISDVRSHQSYYPDRSDTESVDSQLTFVLLQTSADVLAVAFGGGAVTVADGGTLYLPPDPWEMEERAFILDVRDGEYRQLNVFARTRARLTSGVTFPREGDTPIQYEIGATVLNPAGDTKPWYLVATGDLTDDGGS